MEPVFIETWLLGPLLMLLVTTGGGLLIRRLAGGALAAVLVLPVGYGLTVGVTAFLTAFDATAELAGPAICLLAAAGVVLERRTIAAAVRGRRWRSGAALWPAAVAAVAFAVVAAPVVLSGHVTYTGYARIVDIAHQFDFTRWLVSEGRSHPPTRDYSYAEVVTKTLDIGYPAGGQSALGSYARLLGIDIPWFWQAFMAFTGAMLGLGLYGLLGSAIGSRPLRALAAAVAAQPNILYGYALVGGIKEFTSATLLVATAALLPALLARPREPVRAVIPLGVVVAAAFAAFSLTIVPWLGVIAAGVVVLLLLRPDRWATLGRLAVVAAVGLALAAPTGYLAVTKLLPVAGQAEGSGRTAIADLGNLAAAMPVRAVTGIWISGDYRYPELGDRLSTNLLIVVALVLIVAGSVRVVRRRDWPLVLLGASAALAVLYYVDRTGPWIQFKALTTSAPIVLAFVFVGAAEGAEAGMRLVRGRVAAVVAWGAAGLVGAGVIVGNAYAYHNVTLAPHDRLRDLQHLGDTLAGKPALLPAWEEAGEYFLRDQHLSARPNGFLQIRPEVRAARPDQQFAFDPDDVELRYLESQQLLVLRRAPDVGRPPANFRLERRTAHYDVWRRVGAAGSVVDHVPSPDVSSAARRAACRALVRRAKAARRSGGEQRLAYARGRYTAVVRLGSGATASANWKPAGRDALFMFGPGHVERGVGLPRGTYDVWVAGAVSRPLAVTLDGRSVGTVSDAWSYPGGWSRLGPVTVTSDRGHVLRLTRGGGTLAPGNGAQDQPIGPVVFSRRERGAGLVRTAPLRRAPQLCRESGSLDWIELVRGLDGVVPPSS